MSDNMDKIIQHLDKRFDKLEDKIDDHLQRISKAEEAIVWLRGHVKLATALFLAAAGTVFTWFFGGRGG